MDCPVCKNAMVVLELQQVEVDHCFGCGGIWLDAGELELLIDDAVRSAELLESFKIDTNCTETKRKCPICYKKMDKVVVSPSSHPSTLHFAVTSRSAETGKDKPTLLLDRCPKKHGLWFDSGELQDILKRAQLDSDSKIQQLLAEMFSNAKPDKQ